VSLSALSLKYTTGDLDSLRFEEEPLPAPGLEDVVVRVHTAGINFHDVLVAYLGLEALSLIPTCEYSGYVEQVGAGVRDFKPGDEVSAFSLGHMKSRVVLPARDVVLRPAPLSLSAAGCFPLSFATAHWGLNQLAQLRSGERVLIHSAAGGVGGAAIQIARNVGAEIFATAGNEEKRSWLRSEGVTHVYDSRSLDFAEQIRADTKSEGIDVVLNSLPGDAARESFKLLRWGGRFLEIGKKDFIDNAQLSMGPFLHALSFFSIDMAEMVRRNRGASLALRAVREMLDRKLLDVRPLKLFPVAELATAYRYMGSGKHIGRIGVTF
jgi:NADPH:quinone reductase-like Zn-dependent oxidoreductase